MAATIAITNLNSAVTLMYANCDANQLYNQFAGLTNFSSVSGVIDEYGRLGSRAIGLLIWPLWPKVNCIKDNMGSDDLAAGQCLGEALSMFLDAIL